MFRILIFKIVLVTTLSCLSLTPITSFAISPESLCKSQGNFIKVKSEYFLCKKFGKQFTVKKVNLTDWQKSLFASATLTDVPKILIEPFETAAGWSSIPFLKEIKWTTDEGRFPSSDGIPIQNGDGDKVLLMGDSLAAAIGPAFLSLQRTMNWNLRIVFRSSCQIATTKVSYHSSAQLEKCNEARADRIKAINDFRPNILVLIEDPLNPIIATPGKTILETWEKGFAKTLARYSLGGTMKLIVLSRPFGLPKSFQYCVNRNLQLSSY